MGLVIGVREWGLEYGRGWFLLVRGWGNGCDWEGEGVGLVCRWGYEGLGYKICSGLDRKNKTTNLPKRAKFFCRLECKLLKNKKKKKTPIFFCWQKNFAKNIRFLGLVSTFQRI